MPDTQTIARVPRRAPAPFATADALKAAHADLLRRRRFSDDAPEFLDEVQAYVTQVQATGVLLDTDAERSQAQTLLNYWSNALCHAGAEMPDAILAEFDDTQAPELPESSCPYGSMEFGPARDLRDLRAFPGWERLLKDCVENLEQTGIVAVVGAAGSGRSSLVRAGLLPTLQQRSDFGGNRWRYYVMAAPGVAPLAQLAQVVKPAGADCEGALESQTSSEGAPAEWLTAQVAAFRQDSGHLTRLLDADSDVPAVLVIDQFESILQAGDYQEAQAFVDNLLTAVNGPGPRHLVALVMRSDCLNLAGHLEGMPAVLQHSQVFVAFTTRELRQAIEEPAKHVGLRFDEGVVDRVLRDIQGDPSAMTLLQFTLLNFWDQRRRNRITEEMYHRLGAGRLALERVAEGLYKGLSAGEQETLKRILLHLVQPTAGQEIATTAVRRGRLYSTNQDRAQVDRVFERLVRARLVRVSAAERPEDALVSVWHEALVSHWARLVEWLNDERDHKRRRLRLTAAAEQWRDKGRDEGALWSGSLLAEAQGYQDLAPLEAEFVQASEELQTRRQRREKRNRRIAIAVGVVFASLLVTTLSVFLVMERQVAEEQTKRADEKAEAAKNEEALRREVQQQLTAFIVERGVRSIESNDLTGSQLFFTRALELDQGIDVSDNIHRIRIGAALRQLPRLSQLLFHKDLTCAAFSPDGLQVVSTGIDGRVKLWDVVTGKDDLLAELTGARPNYVAFGPKGSLVVGVTSASPSEGTGAVMVWETTSGKPRTLTGWQGGAVRVVAFSPDGRSVLAAGESNSADRGQTRILDVQTGRNLLSISHDGERINHAAFSPDGQRIVLSIEELDCQTGQARIVMVEGPDAGDMRDDVFLLHDAGVKWAAFSPDGSKVVTACHDGAARIWDWKQARVAVPPLKHGGSVYCAAFSPDGRYVATGSRDRTARIWESATGEPVTPPLYDTGTVGLALFSDSGDRFLTRGTGTIRVWGLATANQAPTTLKTAGSIHNVLHSDQGRCVLVLGGPSGGGDGGGMSEARLWDARRGEPLTEVLKHENRPLTCAAVSANGRWVATAALAAPNATEVWIWEVAHSTKKAALRAAGRVEFMELSEDGKHLLTAAAEPDTEQGMQRLRTWNAMSGEPGGDLGPSEPVNCAAFSPDNQWLAAGAGRLINDTGTVQVWNVPKMTGGPADRQLPPDAVLRHDKDKGGVLHLAFSQDSALLVSASADDTAQAWSLADKRVSPVGTPLKHTADVTFAAFSADGSRLVTVSKDGSAVVWERKAEPAAFEQKWSFKHEGVPNHAAFHPEKELIATASSDGTARVWEMKGGELVTILRHPGAMRLVAFAPKDHLSTVSYLTAGGGRQVQTRLWSIAGDNRPVEDLRLFGKVVGARQLTEKNDLESFRDPDFVQLEKHWRYLKNSYPDEFPAGLGVGRSR